ncbi:MAG: hypothetical protein ACI4XM_06460 [Candidatus Coprovivens sp.]
MERELIEQELEQVTAGYQVNQSVAEKDDELDLDALDNIKAGMGSRELAAKTILEHPELYREKVVDQAVAEIIAMEEQNAAMENVSQGMRR